MFVCDIIRSLLISLKSLNTKELLEIDSVFELSYRVCWSPILSDSGDVCLVDKQSFHGSNIEQVLEQ